MAERYKNIQGWFDYQDFYDFILSQFDEGLFIEIGVWKGKSVAYMAERIKELNKTIILFGIDTFKGTEGDTELMNDPELNSLLKICKNNLKSLSVHIMIGNSQKVHKKFPDKSVDFLFIDGDHRYEAVKKDIQLWLPKIIPGGFISGHDYVREGNCGVIDAVNEFFPNINIMGRVWYIRKI